jgi:hypothetical protein
MPENIITPDGYISHYPLKPIPSMNLKQLYRYFAKVDERGEDECWEWKASRTDGGYGQYGINGTMYLANRIAYRLGYDQDPAPFVVMHACDNPPCCNWHHLSRGTHMANHEWRRGAPGMAIGKDHGMAELTDEQVIEMRIKRQNRATLRDLSEEYEISKGQVARICRGEAWTHVAGPRTRGICVGLDKMTPEQRTATVQLRAEGWSQQRIADLFGVSQTLISALLLGKIHKNS